MKKGAVIGLLLTLASCGQTQGSFEHKLASMENTRKRIINRVVERQMNKFKNELKNTLESPFDKPTNDEVRTYESLYTKCINKDSEVKELMAPLKSGKHIKGTDINDLKSEARRIEAEIANNNEIQERAEVCALEKIKNTNNAKDISNKGL